MRTVVGLEDLAPERGGISLAIGTFDGVHVGHRTLIAAAREDAARRGTPFGVMTWDRHPNATLRPDRTPPMLSSQERKVELIASLDVDVLYVLPFDHAFSQISAEGFAAGVLGERVSARAVFVGEGWRFGHKAQGDVDLLREAGSAAGYEVTSLPLVEVEGEPASSSRTRRAVTEGDMKLAHSLLARPFDVDGIVERGASRGRDLGVPTANISPDPALVRPPNGVYATRVRVRDAWHVAATNVGVNPTFTAGEDAPVKVESYILDFDGDIYGETVRVQFHERLRDEIRFGSVDELIAQMRSDIATVRDLLA